MWRAGRKDHSIPPRCGGCSNESLMRRAASNARRRRGRTDMVIVMEKHAPDEKIETVVAELIRRGFDVHRSTGSDQTVLGVVGDVATIDPREFEVMDGVQEAVRVSEPYKLSSRTFKRDKTIVNVNGCAIGGKDVIVMAGPCTIENEKQMFGTAEAVARAGAKVLRGG